MSLIVIEGLDGSGKGTQASLLYDRLQQARFPVKRITFPDYQEPSSALVRMYLNGDFGENPSDVNPYAASTFYAVDRYASYHRFWQTAYHNKSIIIADRYTTSNIIYQMGKLPPAEWEAFCSWLYDFEFQKLCLPKPDLVIYLDMLPEISQRLLLHRYGGDLQKKDIHERNQAFLTSCRKCAMYAVEKYQWSVIPCFQNGEPVSVDKIAGLVWEKVMEVLEPIC